MNEPTFEPADAVVQAMGAWWAQGHRVALATVVATFGSSPRPTGSLMAIRDDGAFAGSVSGGCVEGSVLQAADRVLARGEPRLLEFGVTEAETGAIGLACGGTIQVHLEPALPARLQELVDAEAARRRVERWVPTTRDGLVSGSRVVSNSAEADALDPAEGFLHRVEPRVRLVLVGAVHIAQALAPMAARLGWDVCVVDPREAFATGERFPTTRLEHAWPQRWLAENALDADSALVTLTHDEKLDEPALAAGLRSDAFYLGALGGRKTQAARRERLGRSLLEDAIVGPDALDGLLGRIHGPVGLPIGAREPEEIAVSILAEIVQARRTGGP